MPRADDSVAGCKWPQFPDPQAALRRIHTLLPLPASAPPLPLSSSPAKRSRLLRSILPFASRESLFATRSTPPPARPTSPSSASSPFFSRLASVFYHGSRTHPIFLFLFLFLFLVFSAISVPSVC